MRIKRMKATFGQLEGAVLEFRDGLNVIEAPNEGGKSTWCAFLRAMFYGIPTKERDRVGHMAEKNRYQPWSGSVMEGELELVFDDTELTLRRFQRGAVPFGGFEAVYTGTAELIPTLTAERVGEAILGVPREVFERSAFVGQSAVPVDGNPELEKRIAALVSSGEEDVSYSGTERKLRDWQNRRRHHKSGLIPTLEGELQELDAVLLRLDHVGRALAEAQGERSILRAKITELATEQMAQQAQQDKSRREEYDKAMGYLQQCQSEIAGLTKETGPLIPRETLRAAQGDLAYYNTLVSQLKLATKDLEEATCAVDVASHAAYDPMFDGLTAEQARAQMESQQATLAQTRKHWSTIVVLVSAIAATAVLIWLNQPLWSMIPAIAGLAVCGFDLVMTRRMRKNVEGLLGRYHAKTPADLTRRVEEYSQHCAQVEEALKKRSSVEHATKEMTQQRESLFQRLLALAQSIAPKVTDVFGISAAISKALSLDERLATAHARLEGAQKLVNSLPVPTEEPSGAGPSGTRSNRTPQQTANLLSMVREELQRAESNLAMIMGERNTLGDPVALESRRSAVAEELERRQEEYEAITTALDVLNEASIELQARYSPTLSRRAGELFAALTGGKYEEVTLTREFEVLAREEGAVLPRRSLSLSRGTIDQLYLAVRLAVCELALSTQNPAPLVLDDALSDFDDTRMGQALELLNQLASQRQILLFTCHTREQAWLNRLSR